MNNTNLYAARKARLNRDLVIIGNWCIKRAEGKHNADTTMTMLTKKLIKLQSDVDKAGWATTNLVFDDVQSDEYVL